jgi:hypothetical protein
MLSNYTGIKLTKLLTAQSDIARGRSGRYEKFSETEKQNNTGTPPTALPSEFEDYNIYMGLCLTSAGSPDVDDDGTTLTALEPTADEYKRVLISQLPSDDVYVGVFGTIANRAVTNTSIIFFPEARSAWGECSYWFFVDGQGNLLAYGELTSPITPTNGKVPLVDLGDITISFGNTSTHFGNQLCAIVTGKAGAIFTPTRDVFVALCNSEPDADDTGTTLAAIEPSRENGYVRAKYNQFMSTVDEDGSTNEDIIFFSIVRSGGWGTLTHFALVSAQEGGEILGFGSLTPFTPSVDTVPLIRAADLVVDFNPSV